MGIDITVALIAAFSALLVALVGIFKVYLMEKQLTKRKLSTFKAKQIEDTIKSLGDLIEEFIQLRHILKRISSPVEGVKVDRMRKKIDKAGVKIEDIFAKMVSYGLLCRESDPLYKEVHGSKNCASSACRDVATLLNIEKVTELFDCSNDCSSLAKDLFEVLRSEQFNIIGVQSQLHAKYGTVI